jgi:5'-3' exonuclease
MVDEDDLEEGEKQKITLKKLIEVNLISEDEELAQKCNGYVIISNDETELEDVYEINYQPYIKCGKRYISTNYEYAKYKENW